MQAIADAPGRTLDRVIVPPPLPRLADTLRRSTPSCGASRLIAVDGHAGSGKSTFAALLSTALGGAPVLHLDALATHAEPFEWTGSMRRQVIEPLSRGEPAHYRPYDWDARAFGAPLTLPAAPVVLVEGVGAGRAALRPWLARLLWMELPREEAWRRGRRRDGPALTAFWDGWTAAERAHFAADPSRPFAQYLVRQQCRTDSAPGHAADEAVRRVSDDVVGRISDEAVGHASGEAVGPNGTERLPGSTRLMAYEVLPGPAGTRSPGNGAHDAGLGPHPE